MCFEALFFDLDDTIYPPNAGIWQAIGKRMDQFIVEKLGLPVEIVPQLRENLYAEYGTTMRGLEAVYKINVQEFLDYVHDIPIKNYLQSDEELRQTLALYPSRKIIFTNADTNHARRVLCTLGVDEFFEQVIDIHAIRPFCKPQPEAFEKALTIAGVIDPTKCVMIDDSYPNLVSAHEMGLFTIQVGTEVRSSLVDAVVLTLFDLPSVLPVKITEV